MNNETKLKKCGGAAVDSFDGTFRPYKHSYAVMINDDVDRKLIIEVLESIGCYPRTTEYSKTGQYVHPQEENPPAVNHWIAFTPNENLMVIEEKKGRKYFINICEEKTREILERANFDACTVNITAQEEKTWIAFHERAE